MLGDEFVTIDMDDLDIIVEMEQDEKKYHAVGIVAYKETSLGVDFEVRFNKGLLGINESRSIQVLLCEVERKDVDRN